MGRRDGRATTGLIRRGAELAAACILFPTTSVQAFEDGVAFNGCDGCHDRGDQTVTLDLSPSDPAPGALVDVRIVVEGAGSVLGLYVEVEGGDLVPVAGEGLMLSGIGLTHRGTPLPVEGGTGVAEFQWRVPDSVGASRFLVSTVVGNGNGRSGGDSAADQALDVVYGCASATFFLDRDQDGFGTDGEPRLFCEGTSPDQYATRSGDCNDFSDTAFPEAPDVCNQRDDDCDDVADEGAEDVDLYPDADRDGYYSRAERESGMMMLGCPEAGSPWAANPGDCAPNDPETNPGADEVCNLADDDCDFDVDERARPICGIGACRRASDTCELDDCVPGEPRDEFCNLLDDDCDGRVDEATCEPGQICIDFECVADPAAIPMDPAGSSSCALADTTVPWWCAVLSAVFLWRGRKRRFHC